MKYITSINDAMLCPKCDSCDCYEYNTDLIEFGPVGIGYYHVECHCRECGKDFLLCTEFNYSITKSYAH